MPTDEEIKRALSELAAGPPGLARLVKRLPEPAWDYRERERGGWSPRQIVAHLADLEFNLHWTARVARILYEDVPTLCAPEPDWRALEHRHAYQDPQVALGVYTLARKHLVAELRGQSAAAWERTGIHPEAGRLTLLQVAQGFARHERRHGARIAELEAMAAVASPPGA